MECPYSYVGFVGCYTKPGQADPFELSHGGIPHDRTKVGNGVIAFGVASDGRISFLNNGEPVIHADELPNPSYLTIVDSIVKKGTTTFEPLRRRHLFVTSELHEGRWQPFVLQFQNTDNGLAITAEASGELLVTGGSYPCHIHHAYLPTMQENENEKNCVLISNYGEEQGILCIFCDNDENAFDEKVRIPFGPGSKVDLMRQQSSHAHSSCTTPSKESSSLLDLYAANLGSDAVIHFSVNYTSEDQNSLKCFEKGRLAAPPGSGPRSLMFNPNPLFDNIAIVSLEMTAQVWLIRSRHHDGCLEGLGPPISLLPDGWPGGVGSTEASEMQFNRGRWASDAVWSPDGKFVYAAARLHDSISVFELQYEIDRYHQKVFQDVQSTSALIYGLNLVHRIPTNGRTPRCLAMSDCGEFLLVAHQHSHDVASFRRSKDNGMLTFVNKLNVNSAACVKLMRSE